MTKIRPGTHYTIDIWSGKPVTVEYEDWGNKEVKYFVFTPKNTEEHVRIYITEADYVSWFGQNNGGGSSPPSSYLQSRIVLTI
jgi:hypothetical protein